jgi:hypothetical protein
MLAALEAWLREQRSRSSRAASVAQPIDYMLKRWDDFARCLGNGRICLTNISAEALRGFALGRKCWLFAGSERGADRAAVIADRDGEAQRHRSASLACMTCSPASMITASTGLINWSLGMEAGQRTT